MPSRMALCLALAMAKPHSGTQIGPAKELLRSLFLLFTSQILILESVMLFKMELGTSHPFFLLLIAGYWKPFLPHLRFVMIMWRTFGAGKMVTTRRMRV